MLKLNTQCAQSTCGMQLHTINVMIFNTLCHLIYYLHGQLCNYLKFLFPNATVRNVTKQLFLDVIKHSKAVQPQTNAHHQKGHCGNPTVLKTA